MAKLTFRGTDHRDIISKAKAFRALHGRDYLPMITICGNFETPDGAGLFSDFLPVSGMSPGRITVDSYGEKIKIISGKDIGETCLYYADEPPNF